MRVDIEVVHRVAGSDACTYEMCQRVSVVNAYHPTTPSFGHAAWPQVRIGENLEAREDHPLLARWRKGKGGR